MRAWTIDHPAPIDRHPLGFGELPEPTPGPLEVRVRVRACGVCRTDLHLAEGDLAPRRPRVVPGHEVVGTVDLLGEGAQRFELGERVGVAWLRRTCGACRWCRTGRENLCVAPLFTGWDEDGGFAEYAVVDERYAYALPAGFSDLEAAPLLCAGIIGYRALRRADLPPYGRLGIYGFGASAHIAAQVAIRQGAAVHVFTRSERARELALSLGAASARDVADAAPEPLDAAILFAPSGSLVPVALAALDRGGTLAVAGIHLSDVPVLSYQDHLFEERALTSVTANTRVDGEELLAAASRLQLKVTTTPYPLEAADQALSDLAHGRVSGAAVLVVDDRVSRSS
jgi:propanol-preferring alcohol dehydrogenase